MMVVTPEQYRDGYVVAVAGNLRDEFGAPNAAGTVETEPRSFVLVRRLPDGNYLVRMPALEIPTRPRRPLAIQ